MPKIEQSEYIVTKIDKNIEIRTYEPVILAEVSTEGNRNEAANKAFFILVDYIKGENISNEKIAMTAPVKQQGEKIAMTAPVNQSGENKNWKVSFTMPSKYTMETIPTPEDNRIRLYQTPKEERIVIKFAGIWSDSNFTKNKIKLEKYIKDNNLKIKGDALYAYYNSPFSIPFLRRNEVMYVLNQ
ncbi:MAG: heme-binding protein [bacterium]